MSDEKQLIHSTAAAPPDESARPDRDGKKQSFEHRTEQFRLLAESIPTIVWSADETGHWTYVNNRWTQYTGKTLDQTAGLLWLDQLHPEDVESARQKWKTATESGTDFATELRLSSIAGAHRWFKCEANVLQEQGKLKGWVGSCTDIDDQKRAAELLEEHVRSRTHQLEELNKDLQIARDRALEASSLKSKFVANISHEIRTPMSGVLGMSELLLTCELSEESRELAQYIFGSAKALLEVVNDLLDFSKLEAGKLSVSRMRFTVENVVKEVGHATTLQAQQKGLEFGVELEDNLPDVLGDPLRIRQVLLNLVHNSIKFTHHGKVTVRVSTVERKSHTILVKFEVIDTGIGISKEHRAALFNPFEQADGSTTRRYGGTGLGLSISKSLISLMLGEISFESVEGKGSNFWFQLPLEIA